MNKNLGSKFKITTEKEKITLKEKNTKTKDNPISAFLQKGNKDKKKRTNYLVN